jgi:hypothetical protein
MIERGEFSPAMDAQRDAQALQVAVAVLVSAMAKVVSELAPGALAELRFTGAPDDPDATQRINRHLDNLIGRFGAD